MAENLVATVQNGPHHLFVILSLQHPQSLPIKLLQRTRDEGR